MKEREISEDIPVIWIQSVSQINDFSVFFIKTDKQDLGIVLLN